MRHLVILILLLGITELSFAQELKTPALSPASKLEQTVGLTDITIEFSRPSARGRTIFGGLVPYNEVWRTGANLNSTITFSTDVKLKNIDVKQGAYAIFTIPTKENWDIIIYDAPRRYAPEQEKDLDASKIISRFALPAQANVPYTETFNITIEEITTSTANIVITWADKFISIPLEVSADKLAMQNIKKLMDGPSPDALFQAAEYYYHNDKDLEQALKWAKKSGEEYGWDAYWPHYLEARILVKLNRYDEAIISGEKAAAYVRKGGYLVTADKIDQKLISWKKKLK